MQVSAARVQARQYASQGRAVERAAQAQTARRVAAERASQAKRASRVEVSALRKRTGGAAPILVRRRANIARALAAPVSAPGGAQARAKGPVKLKGPQPITSRPRPKERKIQQAAIERQAKGQGALYSTDPEVLKRAGLKQSIVDKYAGLPFVALANVPKDIGELAITTPTSLAHIGVRQAKAVGESVSKASVKPLAKEEVKTVKEFAKPYQEFAKNPVKFATERPVTSFLMFAGGPKGVGRLGSKAAGKVARVTGKQALERPAATLPGTSLRQQRIGSRGYVERRRQAKEDVAKGAPTISTTRTARRPTSELDRRTDEFYDASRYHKQRVTKAAAEQANERFGHLPKDERAAKTEEHISGARGDADRQIQEQFGREFGSHWQVGERGTILKPKNPEEGSGVLHGSKADADRIAERVPFDAHVMQIEGRGGGPSKWAVVPKQAHQRFGHHQRVGKSPATGAVLLRAGTRQFRQATLPLSVRWLGGQVAESAFRAAIKGAGPISYLRGRRILKATGEPFKARTTQTGQFSLTGPAREFAEGKRTLAEEFAPTGLAKQAEALTRAGQAPGIRHVRRGFGHYTNFVFNDVNGKIEELAKTAMLGKQVKRDLMEHRILGLSDTAIQEAAQGLRGTAAQVELGRAIDRSYGKYSKFGPHARETLMHSTPYFPWFRNMVHFLARTLPRDHPIKAALLADLNEADREWRKANRVSLYGEHVPDFLMGGMPTPSGKVIPVGRFGPFLPGEYVSSAGGQVLPQLQGALLNAAGVDWTGKAIKGGQGRLAANVGLTLGEALLPGLSQAGRVTGLSERYVRGKEKPSVIQGKNIPKALLDLINPVRASAGERTETTGPAVKVGPVRVKPVRIKPIRVR